MFSESNHFVLATRGSALALAQTTLVLAQCRRCFPRLRFEQKIIKTSGDKLQTASLAQSGKLPRGLFTKELEVALVKGRADLAVHSLKDLPTELPPGLKLGAASRRADVRDVLIYRDAAWLAAQPPARLEAMFPDQPQPPARVEGRGFGPQLPLAGLPSGAVVATGSARRKAQLLERRPDLRAADIRGNVPTRLEKLMLRPELDALILAAAGLERLNFQITPDGRLQGDAVPDGLLAVYLETDVMLPAVGQGAIGIEVRENDGRVAVIAERLNHYNTMQCVAAERAFLKATGGGCQSAVAALAEPAGEQLRLRAVSFLHGAPRRGERRGTMTDAVSLGEDLARELAG